LRKKIQKIEKLGQKRQFLPKKRLLYWFEGTDGHICSNPVIKIDPKTRRKIQIIYVRKVDKKTGEFGAIQEIKISHSKN
jgi:hypothetical protein